MSPWEIFQGFAHGNFNLRAHQVDAGDFLGDGMFDLDALVDFEEIIIAVVVHDELHRAGVGVTRRLGNAHGGLADFIAQLFELVFQQGRRRFLDQFLVAALDGAIAFAQDE